MKRMTYVFGWVFRYLGGQIFGYERLHACIERIGRNYERIQLAIEQLQPFYERLNCPIERLPTIYDQTQKKLQIHSR
ncbi:hypothetical protein [Sporosarcina ureae]|uniref:hypothetical protein n=1 Tax=Sporosarcina ureae TaxID=1571 RepID=UPI0012F487C3|nr:hypothetical protein [Sporosarcina ureae]